MNRDAVRQAVRELVDALDNDFGTDLADRIKAMPDEEKWLDAYAEDFIGYYRKAMP